MQRFRFPLAVATTSLALVLILVGVGGLLVNNALASSPFAGGGPWSAGPWQAGQAGHAGWLPNGLPPELAGLTEIPAGERFAHFRGVRVQLADKNNKPLTVEVTPGTTTTVSPGSLTILGNDGSPHTYTLDDKTIVHAKTAARGTAQTAPSTLALSPNDRVVVATLNNSSTATAVVVVSPDGSGSHGPFGR